MESNRQISDLYRFAGSEAFLQSGSLNQLAQAGGVPLEPVLVGSVADLSRALIQSFADYKICVQMEETRRQEITARLRAQLSQITSRHIQVLQYMDHEYGQLGQSIQVILQCVHFAQQMGDMDQVKVFLDFIHNQQQGVREHFRPLIENPLPFDL